MKLNIIFKLLSAYEKQSTATIRVTPQDLGVVVSEIPDGDLPAFVESLKSQMIYMTHHRRQLLKSELSKIGEQ